jgi:hypothetical protein
MINANSIIIISDQENTFAYMVFEIKKITFMSLLVRSKLLPVAGGS